MGDNPKRTGHNTKCIQPPLPYLLLPTWIRYYTMKRNLISDLSQHARYIDLEWGDRGVLTTLLFIVSITPNSKRSRGVVAAQQTQILQQLSTQQYHKKTTLYTRRLTSVTHTHTEIQTIEVYSQGRPHSPTTTKLFSFLLFL